MTLLDPAAAYAASVVTLYLEMPDTPMRVAPPTNGWRANSSKTACPLETVETALLLGSLRRIIRPADSPRLTPIRSLAYFRPVIEELQENPAPEHYRDYLRLKLHHAMKAVPANDRKHTFSNER